MIRRSGIGGAILGDSAIEAVGDVDATASEIVQHIKDGADDWINIYQMLAFDVHTNWLHVAWLYVRAFFAMMAQFASLAVIGYMSILHEVFNEEDDIELCEGDDPWYLRLMSMLLVIVIVLFSCQKFYTFNNYGGYRVSMRSLHNKPDFINAFWIVFGYWVNIQVLMIVTYESIFIIWWTSDAIDVVLNAAAMWFLIDLDQMLVSPEDREELKQFLSTYQHSTDYRMSTGMSYVVKILYYVGHTISILLLFAAVCLTSLIWFCPV
jgi:hypothetical protein